MLAIVTVRPNPFVVSRTDNQLPDWASLAAHPCHAILHTGAHHDGANDRSWLVGAAQQAPPA
eukprot:6034631-Prymnesium_polylepis.1